MVEKSESGFLSLPKVSIITPSFNQGKFIRRTIESVLSQDYTNIEYIVIDGGSKDETLSILKEFKNRLNYFSEKDDGQSNAINKGFRMANGDIFAWLNSDDVYEPGAISHVVKLFIDNPEIAMVYGEGHLIAEDDSWKQPFVHTVPYNLWKLIYSWDYILQPSTFFRRDAITKIGYLNEKLNWSMDWDLWIRIGLKFDILYTHKFLSCSRVYEQTKTNTGKKERLLELKELTKKYSGMDETPGFLLYKLAEMSAEGDHSLFADPLAKMYSVLEHLPSPDRNWRCPPIVNFCVRSNTSFVSFVLINNDTQPVSVSIYINDTFIENRSLACRKVEHVLQTIPNLNSPYVIVQFRLLFDQNLYGEKSECSPIKIIPLIQYHYLLKENQMITYGKPILFPDIENERKFLIFGYSGTETKDFCQKMDKVWFISRRSLLRFTLPEPLPLFVSIEIILNCEKPDASEILTIESRNKTVFMQRITTGSNRFSFFINKNNIPDSQLLLFCNISDMNILRNEAIQEEPFISLKQIKIQAASANGIINSMKQNFNTFKSRFF